MNLIIRAEKTILKNIIAVATHSAANLQPAAILKKNQVFSKKKTNFERLKNLSISVAFYGKFAEKNSRLET